MAYVLNDTTNIKKRNDWSFKELDCLVRLWGDAKVQKYLTTMARNKSIWIELAHRMSEYGYERTWIQCKEKIRTMCDKYKKIKNLSSRSTQDLKNCPFYEEIDAILSSRPLIDPSAVIDTSTNNEEDIADGMAMEMGANDFAASNGEVEDSEQAVLGDMTSINITAAPSTNVFYKNKPTRKRNLDDLVNYMKASDNLFIETIVEIENKRQLLESKYEEKRQQCELEVEEKRQKFELEMEEKRHRKVMEMMEKQASENELQRQHEVQIFKMLAEAIKRS